MSPSAKALLAIIAVTVLAALGIYSQGQLAGGVAQRVGFNQDEMNLFADLNMGPREKIQFSADPEARMKMLGDLRKQLAIVAEGFRRGLDREESISAFIELGAAKVLHDEYVRKHSEGGAPAKASPEEVDAWVAAHGLDLDRYMRAVESKSQGGKPPDAKELAGILVLADKARAERLDDDPQAKLMLKLSRYGPILEEMNEQLDKESALSDAEVEAYYNDHIASGDLDEVHAQHILFATGSMPGMGGPAPSKEEKKRLAEDVLARVRAGEDFAALATQYSDDPGSKEKGGDLDFSPRFRFVTEFEDAAWKLQPGEVSGLVETDYGYHIIKVVERRPGPPLEKIRAQIKENLTQKRYREKVEEIAAALGPSVELPNDFVVKPPAAPATPPHGMMDMGGPGGVHGAPGPPAGKASSAKPPAGKQAKVPTGAAAKAH